MKICQMKRLIINWLRKRPLLSSWARWLVAKSRGDICGFMPESPVIKVWHIYARTYNFGDHALGIGVRRLFREAFKKHGYELVFEVVDTHRFYATQNDVRMWNAEGGLLLVGGGGLLHSWDGIHWMCHLPSSCVKDLKIPLLVFGVGYNQLMSQGRLPRCVRKNINVVAQRAISFTVRNDGSKERMIEEGFNLNQIPDPGFFLDDSYGRLIDDKYAIMQVAGDAPASRMPDEEKWVASLAACASWLMEQGLKVVFLPHCELDVYVTKKVIRILGAGNYYVSDFWSGVLDENCYKIFSLYKHAEIVIATRGHAQIVSYGMGTPFVTFSTHYKQIELSKRLMLEDYATVNPDEFLNKLQAALLDRNLIVKIEEDGMREMRGQMDAYFDSVIPDVIRAISRWKTSWYNFKWIQIQDLLRYVW